MARRKPKRDGPLTPGQARESYRVVRKALLVAVARTWAIVGVAALVAPHVAILMAALAVVYSLSMPLVLRSVRRGIDRRIVGEAGDPSGVAPMAKGSDPFAMKR